MDQNFKTIEEYIKSFPEEIQKILLKIDRIIKKNAPDSLGSISYGMPAYKLNKKPLVYYAAFKSHIGFYATPTGHTKFKKELSKYKQGKGSVQFPLDEPIPIQLIEKIVKFRVVENNISKKGKKENNS